jgi:predicted extracellular nuclease
MKRIVSAVVLMLAMVFPLALPTGAQAAPSELFFSEYIEGSSNNKALEIYNGTGAAVDLAAGGYAIKMYFNGAATANLTINLTGTVADGAVWVVAHPSANAAILAKANQLSSNSGWYNGDDAVVLVKGDSVIDSIGQVGVDPGTEWGSGLTSTADNTLRRKATILAGDSDFSNAFDPAQEWDGYATDTFDGLGSHTVQGAELDPAAPAVSQTSPADGAADVALDASLSVTFSEPVSVSGDWFSLLCSVSGAHSAAVSGGPEVFTLDPDADFVANDACTLTVYAAQVADDDTLDPPDHPAADFSMTFAAPLSGPDTAPTVNNVTPADGAVDVALNADVQITFSEAVTVSDPWFSLTCATSGAHSAVVSGGPVTFTLNPDGSFAPGESCTLTVTAASVSDQDSNDPPDTLAADFTSAFQTANLCTQAYTPIPQIQGSGAAAAITTPITTRGVVVGDYEYPGSGSTSNSLRGFFLQDLSGDGDPATSDGIFVFNGNANSVSLGDVVSVSGTPGEYQGQTQISSVTNITACGAGDVAPVDITFPLASVDDLERYEGMLVRLPQTMVVTEHYQLGRFGQVVLSAETRLKQPTSVAAPGAPALALQAENNLNKIILDDDNNIQNPPQIVFARGGQPLSAANTLRGGDTATGIVGVLNYTWAGNSASPNAYRVRPVNALGGTVDFQPANPRPTAPEAVGGELRVVGMNVLNYFNTFDGLPDNVDNCRLGVDGGTTDCRGADTPEEFARQWPKTVAAILAMNPDVLGVNEIENDGYAADSAIQTLVDQLNAATAPGTYAFIDADAATGQVNALGTDAIKVGMLYKPAKVTPRGVAALNSVEFVNGGDSAPRSRPALAVSFEQNSDGAVFTVVANHFKSKSSACDAPDAGDGQGNCAAVRTRSAQALAAWLATNPTGVSDPDVLIIGDLNSYAQEDPVRALLSAGYTNLVDRFIGDSAYSYVFDGQWGYLDHALSNAALLPQVSGVSEFHINADEPSVLDYNTDYKTAEQISGYYAPDEYRVSDHDPIIVGLNLNAAPSVDAGGPYSAVEGGSVLLSAQGSDPDGGALTFAWDLDGNGSFESAGREVSYTAVDGPQAATVRVQATDPTGMTALDEATLTVSNANPTAANLKLSTALSAVKKTISVTATFSDPGRLDTHTAVWDWGDGSQSAGSVTEANGSGSVKGSHIYVYAGIYTVKLTVTDKDGGAGEVLSQQLVIYHPDGGLLVGAGVIDSPRGAYLPKPNLTGRAAFAFTVKYLKGASVPTGVTDFTFSAANLNFISISNDWLVIDKDRTHAVLRGKGWVNGKGPYQFQLWAEAGRADTLRIKIWKMNGSAEDVLYDNTVYQPLRSGTVVITR